MLKILKPEYILPFAGSYVLGGKNINKNSTGNTTGRMCRLFK